jgi:hypothetical protein
MQKWDGGMPDLTSLEMRRPPIRAFASRVHSVQRRRELTIYPATGSRLEIHGFEGIHRVSGRRHHGDQPLTDVRTWR